VAMHGFPDDSRIYDRLVPHLSGRRVVTFDGVGCGQSRRQGASFEPRADSETASTK
jgi:pimeloyl-ACP methyl ester carboxylesterase